MRRSDSEEVAREIAGEITRSIERASEAHPGEIVRAAGVDPDRVREGSTPPAVQSTEAIVCTQMAASGR